MLEIKVNDKFKCIRTVVMEDGEVAYNKDDIYPSDNSGCITDLQGDAYHVWDGVDDAQYFFKKIL